MGKHKKEVQSKEEPIITDDQRNSNPIFNIIYKRIRNLNKKLINIDQLAKQDPNSLKPEQIRKINSRDEVTAQIHKNQEFTLFYKSILAENQGLAFDFSDYIMKIATLLVVGQYATKLKNFKKYNQFNQIYSQIYKPITESKNQNQCMPDRIADVFNLLNKFIQKQENSDVCHEYISFLSDEPKVQQPQQTIKPTESKEPQKIEEPKVQEKQQIQQKVPESEPLKNKVSEKSSSDWNDSKEDQKPKEVQEKKEPDEEKPAQEKKQTERSNQRSQKNTRNTGRDRNYQNNGNRENNRNKKQYEQKRNWNNQEPKKQENRQNRKRKYKEAKHSDTSLEPTPEKVKPQKPKYIEKK